MLSKSKENTEYCTRITKITKNYEKMTHNDGQFKANHKIDEN